MTSLTTKPKTLADYQALPEGPPNFEFEEGEIVPMASPTIDHQDIVLALASVMQQFTRQNRLGRVFVEVDVFLPDGRVYIPDIGFLAADRLHLISPVDRKVHGTPDLVVKVLSDNEARDRVHKFRVYYENGVSWYWIVASDTLAIEEYHATPQGYVRSASIAAGERFRPGLFPGLEIDLAALLGVMPDASEGADVVNGSAGDESTGG